MSHGNVAHAVEADPSFHGLIGVGRCEMTPEVGIYSHNWGSARHDTADSIHKPLLRHRA